LVSLPGDAVGVRRLTPVEFERLQGFPDGWTATSWGRPQADSPRYSQLGNSIAVPVLGWVARRIVAVDAQIGVTA
jgi:DNA (cytosine-5)-methyltransferase 1